MPMRLGSSPYWTHALAKVVMKHLRSKNIHLVLYVDDILMLGETPAVVEENMNYVVHLLTTLGVQVNFKKSVLTPTQKPVFLRNSLDLEKGEVWPVEDKLRMVRSMCRKMCSGKTIIPRSW